MCVCAQCSAASSEKQRRQCGLPIFFRPPAPSRDGSRQGNMSNGGKEAKWRIFLFARGPPCLHAFPTARPNVTPNKFTNRNDVASRRDTGKQTCDSMPRQTALHRFASDDKCTPAPAHPAFTSSRPWVVRYFSPGASSCSQPSPQSSEFFILPSPPCSDMPAPPICSNTFSPSPSGYYVPPSNFPSPSANSTPICTKSPAELWSQPHST